MKQNRHTLRVLGMLLGYPDAHLRSLLPSLVYAIDAENALTGARRAELRAFIGDMELADPIELETRHAELHLPDHLGDLLEFASTQPPAKARGILGERANTLDAIFSRLRKRESPYGSVLAAIIELAGHTAEATRVAEEDFAHE
jgi:nitrate reductase molybdenum cofactor assembly chaperone NarJ/NarW